MGRWVTSKGRRIYIPDEGEENPFKKPDTSDAYKKNWSKTDAVNEMRGLYKSGEHDISLMKKDGRYSIAYNSKEIDHAEKYGWEYAQGEITDDDKDYITGRSDKLKNQTNKDEDKKEKQIASNKAQADERNKKSEKNTLENRNKLKRKIDDYVKAHPNPTAEDRRKVSEMRDKYDKMMQEAYPTSVRYNKKLAKKRMSGIILD